MRIVRTEDHGNGRITEYFVNVPSLPVLHAQKVVNALNAAFSINTSAPRCWKVVEDSYVLKHSPHW